MIGMMRGKTAALGLMVASLSWANPGFAQEKLKIRLADTYSNTHYVAVEGAQHWMKIVEEALGDRIDFEYFPAQQLGKSADMLSLMESGVADMALTSPAYIGDRLALAQVVELPGMAGTSMRFRRLLSGRWQPMANFSTGRFSSPTASRS